MIWSGIIFRRPWRGIWYENEHPKGWWIKNEKMYRDSRHIVNRDFSFTVQRIVETSGKSDRSVDVPCFNRKRRCGLMATLSTAKTAPWNREGRRILDELTVKWMELWIRQTLRDENYRSLRATESFVPQTVDRSSIILTGYAMSWPIKKVLYLEVGSKGVLKSGEG